MKFLSKCFGSLFKNLFPISLELLSNLIKDFQILYLLFSKGNPVFSNFNISAKFLPSFLKIIAKFFHIPKFYQKLRNTKFCTPLFLHSSFIIFSQLIIIRSYTIMSAKLLQKNWKFSCDFIIIFQQRLSNFPKMSAELRLEA